MVGEEDTLVLHPGPFPAAFLLEVLKQHGHLALQLGRHGVGELGRKPGQGQDTEVTVVQSGWMISSPWLPAYVIPGMPTISLTLFTLLPLITATKTSGMLARRSSTWRER